MPGGKGFKEGQIENEVKECPGRAIHKGHLDDTMVLLPGRSSSAINTLSHTVKLV